MADLALPAGLGIRGRFTRAIGVLLPFAAILTLIAFVLVIISAMRAHVLSRRRSLPSSASARPTKPRLQILGALVTGLAFAFALTSCVLGYYAYNRSAACGGCGWARSLIVPAARGSTSTATPA